MNLWLFFLTFFFFLVLNDVSELLFFYIFQMCAKCYFSTLAEFQSCSLFFQSMGRRILSLKTSGPASPMTANWQGVYFIHLGLVASKKRDESENRRSLPISSWWNQSFVLVPELPPLSSRLKHHWILLIHFCCCCCCLQETHFIFFFNLKKFFFSIYLFMAVLGLRFCARAFSSCGKRGPLFITVRRPLTIAASLVAEHRLQTRRLSSCGSRA